MDSLNPDWCGNVAESETSNVRASLHPPMAQGVILPHDQSKN
jgi:hypothetical protein